MTLGIEDDLESGIELVVLGLGVRMGMVGGWSDVPQGCGSWSGKKWEQNPIKHPSHYCKCFLHLLRKKEKKEKT